MSAGRCLFILGVLLPFWDVYGGGCTSNVDCIAACTRALELDACRNVRCSPRFGRCDCGGAAVLRLDGACVQPVAPAQGASANCSGTTVFDAAFNIVVLSSPEIRREDLSNGSASTQMLTLIRLCVAAAAGCSPGNVSIVQANLTAMDASVANLSTDGLLQFDLSFTFCAAGVSDITPADFEVRWRSEAERYAASQLMSLRLIQVTSLIRQPTAIPEGNLSRPFIKVDNLDTHSSSSIGSGALIGAFVGAAAFVMLAVLASAAILARVRRRRSKVADADGEDHEERAEEGPVLAHVTVAFSPADVEDDKVFQDSCLELQEGDIVEVITGGGGWLCGRLLRPGEDMRIGFFPENRVSWIGQLSESDLAGGEQQYTHALVTVERGFSPSDLEGDPEKEGILTVAAGEVVEVLAGRGSWLFGRVAGDPDRVGYFPENYATALQPAPNSDTEGATRSQACMVRVEKPFSPGVPGDAEEEDASFGDSCLALAEGDVVEVAAAGGGWLYGRVVGDPSRAGYFPETRVSWLGRPVEAQTALQLGQPQELRVAADAHAEPPAAILSEDVGAAAEADAEPTVGLLVEERLRTPSAEPTTSTA